jgi:WD40 repeat protein
MNTLISQALEFQKHKCLYHVHDDSNGLLADHQCHRSGFPTHTAYIFDEHQDEVWYIAFSNDGTKLASASRDARAIIWDLNTYSIKFVLKEHKLAISHLAWSPDDRYLLTGSNDCTLKLWDTVSGMCLRTFNKHKDAITCCKFLPDGKSFISGSAEKNTIQWDINGSILYQWIGVRGLDFAISGDGKTLYVSDKMKIRSFDLISKLETGYFEEIADVVSISLTKNSDYLLVNLKIAEIHLWDIKQKTIAKKYFGQAQGSFVIRSAMGGVNENFVVSGSDGIEKFTRL